jgi:hypothetical protein
VHADGRLHTLCGKEEADMHATVVVSAHALGRGGEWKGGGGGVCACREGVCTRVKVGGGGWGGGGRGDEKECSRWGKTFIT